MTSPIPVLAERYHVIAPDLRGYGETDKPATGYDKRTMALDLVELLRALGIPKLPSSAMIAGGSGCDALRKGPPGAT